MLESWANQKFEFFLTWFVGNERKELESGINFASNAMNVGNVITDLIMVVKIASDTEQISNFTESWLKDKYLCKPSLHWFEIVHCKIQWAPKNVNGATI